MSKNNTKKVEVNSANIGDTIRRIKNAIKKADKVKPEYKYLLLTKKQLSQLKSFREENEPKHIKPKTRNIRKTR